MGGVGVEIGVGVGEVGVGVGEVGVGVGVVGVGVGVGVTVIVTAVGLLVVGSAGPKYRAPVFWLLPRYGVGPFSVIVYWNESGPE